MDRELTRFEQAEITYMLRGDLSGLEDDEIAHLYRTMCESRGWDWLTRPFELMGVDDTDDEGNPVTRKELYPTRQASALLARDHGYCVEDRGEIYDWDNGVYTARARAIDPTTGRYWDDEGCTAICREEGGQYVRMWPSKVAIAVRIAKTQARRRAILGLSALAKPDAESEMAGVRGARALPMPANISQASERAVETRKTGHPIDSTQNVVAPRVSPPGQKSPRYLTPEEAKRRIGRLEKALREDGYKVQPMRGPTLLEDRLRQLEALAETRGLNVAEPGGGAGDTGEYMSY